ncbi:MAG: radical SAM protein [Theionarchaea archaeon]|nr:radical SAM protein [Theionarchaea archaeon]
MNPYILHCTPPYWHTIPNAALGYLKGFLEAQGIPVTNVYWNVVLSRKIGEFQKVLANYPGYVRSFPKESVVFFIGRHLLKGDDSKQTTADQIFSAMYTQKEIDDAIHGIREDIDEYILLNNLDRASLSGFTVKSHQWLMSLYVINRLKSMNPDTKVVMGGIVNEGQAQKFMNMIEADFAVWGEGEYPLYKLVKALKDGTPFEEVPQLVYRENGKIRVTKKLAECPPLDEYPFADHTDYFTIMKKVDPFNKSILIPVWGSRSCPWNKCRFCVLNEEYQYRTRSPQNIVEEIEYQSEKYNISSFQFTDSDVAGNRKRFTTLLDLIIQSIQQRKNPYHIYGDISPIFIDSETAKAMKRAGFVDMQIGFEAVSDSLLKKMQKRQKLVHNIQALKSAQQCNLNLAGLNIIRGIPTETEDDVKESCYNVKFFRFFLGSYFLEPTLFMLLKGSIFYDEMSEEKKEWDEDSLWREIASTHLVDDKDRFEFFNFYRKTFPHYHLWEMFWHLLRFYGEQNMSYAWTTTSGGSFVKEKGRKTIQYSLNQNETDVLIFCDTITSLRELQKEFSYIQEDELSRILIKLQGAALLYRDTEGTCISILDTGQKIAQANSS